MLSFAQRGKIVVAAMGPGTGKTKTARQYKACYPNVSLATMAPSSAGVINMQIEVLESLGEKDPVGTPQKLSKRIRGIVANMRSPLLIVDEAQHLSEKSLEEIRSWNDATGIGIALFGNSGVLQRLEGGNRREAFAQLFSRVSLKVVRPLPLTGDVDAMANAWNIHDEAIRAYLRRICMTPGGLRSGTMALELATMIAASERRVLALENLQDAWTQLFLALGAVMKAARRTALRLGKASELLVRVAQDMRSKLASDIEGACMLQWVEGDVFVPNLASLDSAVADTCAKRASLLFEIEHHFGGRPAVGPDWLDAFLDTHRPAGEAAQ